MTVNLSSDILEAQFGPTQLEVLRQEGLNRLICTKAADNGQVLELSQVTFMEPGISQFPDVHRAVLAGESMGKAFRDANIKFERQTLTTYRQAVPAHFRKYFASDQPATISAVRILIGPAKIAYADILEVYSPVVEWPVTDDRPTVQYQSLIDQIDGYLAKLSFGKVM